MDITKRKKELQGIYEEKKKTRDGALNIAEQARIEMTRIEGAFQELEKMEQEDKPKEKKDDSKK